MEVTSLIISIASFAFSGFTFYWLSVRKRDALFLVRVDSFGRGLMPEFAFVNSGDYDVLITDVKCFFNGADKSTGAYPEQQLRIHSEGSFLLEKGKLLHCSAEFRNPLPESVFALGAPSTRMEIQGEHLRMLDLNVVVKWVRSDGESFSHEQTLFQYGVSSKGVLHSRSPLPSHRERKFRLDSASKS